MPFYAIILLVVITAGIVMGFVSISSLIGYAIGIALGITLVLVAVRKLGKKAHTSLSASKSLYKITKHKATVYHIHQQDKTTTATVYGDAHEYANLVDVLKGMGFPAITAKEAAKHAMDTMGDDPFEEKARVALQYLGKEPKKEAIGN